MARAAGDSWHAPAVLIVDDREDQRLATRAMLTRLGVGIVEAESGRAALDAVLQQTFALILMDVRMPLMNGYETAKLIREHQPSRRTPIIFITAGDPEDRETLTTHAGGAIDFIFAPIAADVLRAKVSFFVDLFVQAQELQRSLDSITALNQTLRDVEASTRGVLESVADGVVMVDPGGLIESMNRSARSLFGYGEDALIGKPLTHVIAPPRRHQFDDLRRAAEAPLGEGTRSKPIQTLGCRRDGSTFAMEVERAELDLAHGTRTLALVRDISERQAYTERLEHQALHDGLTGLPNRTLFEQHVLQALALAKRAGESRAVLAVDLDGFKRVNDSLGHAHGDTLLSQVGERLVAALREADTVARMGGDEFAILPGGAADLAAAAAVAWKVQQTLKQGFVLGDEVTHVGASIGIALFPEHGTTTAELLGRADTAMYVAKKTGSGHAVFDAAQATKAAAQLALLVDLRRCLDRGELVLHYQPKIDLLTRRLSGVEALLRWRHPTHGLLAPASFMPDVERTELIVPVTRWVLDEALRQQRAWQDQGVDLAMAVNISAQSLRTGSDLSETVAECTEVWSTRPGRLILELTEGALIEAAAPDILNRLHDMGQMMSIDDFGTGYSSLAFLRRLPVDELKIDRSFMMQLAAAGDDEVIVRSTIDLAHNLGLTVVAEGVETEAVLKLLTDYRCDAAQGFLFSPPREAEEFTAWMMRSPYAPPQD